MSITIVSVSIRVVLNCIVFSYFLCASLESKLRYSMKTTRWLLALLTGITLGITIYYLTPGVSEGRNNTLGIVLWILSAMIVLTVIIKGSCLEILFEENGGAISVKTDIQEDMQMRDTDLCVVLGNLLENAVEACMHQDSEERMISVRAGIKGKQLVLKVQNTHHNIIHVKEDVFYSTKHEGKGVGLRLVKRVVDEYQEGMKVEYDENHFTVNIFLHVGNKM